MAIQQLKHRGMIEDARTRCYIQPTRIVWSSATSTTSQVINAEGLLAGNGGQVTKEAIDACILVNSGSIASVLLDFGVELHGGVQLSVTEGTVGKRSFKMRVRFGESAMEAMSELGGELNATNDHVARDSVIDVGLLGATEFGTTGFRFIRIDLLDEGSIDLQGVQAIFVYNDIPYRGSFRCNDELLNQIWDIGAYTVHLNMQDYLWDGIKRDRLVWTGDLHPEVATINAVFGESEIVARSLDFKRDRTPLPMFMDMATYSIWWLIVHHDWYMQHGNRGYLEEQREYIVALIDALISCVDEKGTIHVQRPFLDWPASPNIEGVNAGVHALFVMAMQVSRQLALWLDEQDSIKKCEQLEVKLRQVTPYHAQSKQAAALQSLAGLIDPLKANDEVIAPQAPKGYSTFYGYYMLRARALAGDITRSLDSIRSYWGGMISLGATSFWEDFDIDWLDNAGRIDELTPYGKVDVHGTYGGYCYKGYRHSLCHGWASGPTAWLSENILGISVLEAGCKKVKIAPQLGDLQWAEGTYPTPYGDIWVKHEKQEDGTIRTEVRVPDQVTAVMANE